MSDWWARRLGGDAPQQRQAPPPSPPAGSSPMAPPGAVTTAPQRRLVTMENFGEAMTYWRGGPGARNVTHCPACGSDALYRRKVGQSEAAPLCYNCGYNGLFQQADPSNWQ